MDEMTLLRDLRAGIPQPDRGRLAAGRRNLLKAARGQDEARRARSGRRLAAVGSAAAIGAVAVVSGQIGTKGEEPGFVPVARPAYITQPGSAAQFLEQAADAIARRPVPAPRQDRWVYVKEAEANATDQEHRGVRERESWTRYADPALEQGRAGDDHSPREQYRFLAGLPHDVNAVKAKARAFCPGDGHESRTQHEFRALKVLARSYPAPPEGLATVYRALATLPGIKAARATDVLGRDAIAIFLPGNGQGDLREEFLIDPRTYVYTGSRWIAQSDRKDPRANAGDRWRKGDVIIDDSVKDVALVARRNERP